jgi:hypothetical protein
MTMSLATDDAEVVVASRGMEIARYVFRPDALVAEGSKPYLHPLRTLDGAVVTAFRPWDHRWHKGLQMTWTYVSGQNFWGGPSYIDGEGYVSLDNVGSMRHERFTAMDETGTDVGFLLRIDTQKATVTVDHLYGHGHENWSITAAPGFENEAAAWSLPEHEERSDHGPLLRDVFNALLSGRPLPSTASDPARSFEIVAAIYASAAADGAVVTPTDLATHPTHRRSFASPVTDLRR